MNDVRFNQWWLGRPGLQMPRPPPPQISTKMDGPNISRGRQTSRMRKIVAVGSQSQDDKRRFTEGSSGESVWLCDEAAKMGDKVFHFAMIQNGDKKKRPYDDTPKARPRTNSNEPVQCYCSRYGDQKAALIRSQSSI